MKIAIFIQEMAVGGVSTFSLNLSRMLHSVGHEITVITLTYALAGVNLAAWNCAVGVSPKVQQVTAAQAISPFAWADYLPSPVRSRLSKTAQAVHKLGRYASFKESV